MIETSNCTGDVYWQLQNEGEPYWYTWSRCDLHGERTLEPGEYEIVVFTDFGSAGGEYELDMRLMPEPEHFTIATGDTITDGVPGPGAGNLESDGATDVYQFTVNAPQYVTFDAAGCPPLMRATLRNTIYAYGQGVPMCTSAYPRLLYPVTMS